METKKQEAIRLAWIEQIGEEAYKHNKVFISEEDGCMDYDLRFGGVINEIEIVSEDKASGWAKVRPKSLSGIENNNGWISILSEEDLKLERGYYWFKWKSADGEENIQIAIVDNRGINLYQEPTHYQPIQKPQPPIF